MSSKKKAFTLTELLVVVIVIGVLSAVVLPKFNKVIETRRTTEAEEIMAAIRTEQDRRCTLGKRYTKNMDSLQDIVPHAQTRNYEYSLTSTGAIATSKGSYAYELKVPSYADGRVCCEGEACSKLNKDYPACGNTFQIASADVAVDTECRAPCETPTGSAPTCPAGQTGMTCTWDANSCSYACSGACRCRTTPAAEWAIVCPGNQTGRRCRWNSVTCQFDKDCTGECTSCPHGPQGETKDVCSAEGQSGRTCSWNTQTCSWNTQTCAYDKDCTGTCACQPPNGEMTKQVCQGRTCEWSTETCAYDKNCQGECEYDCNISTREELTQSCATAPEGSACGDHIKTRTATCNRATGQWVYSAWGECRPQGCEYTISYNRKGCASIGTWVVDNATNTTYCTYVGPLNNVPRGRDPSLARGPSSEMPFSFHYAAAGINYTDVQLPMCYDANQSGAYRYRCPDGTYHYPVSLGYAPAKCTENGTLQSFGCGYFAACNAPSNGPLTCNPY